jgi:hypothetical protein
LQAAHAEQDLAAARHRRTHVHHRALSLASPALNRPVTGEAAAGGHLP